MPSLEEKLNQYEDFELAFVLHHKAKHYTKETRKKVYQEIHERGLRKVDLERLRKDKLNTEIQDHNFKICPRCTSTKISHVQEIIVQRSESFNGMVNNKPNYRNHYTCDICGWDFDTNFTKTEKKTFLFLLLAFLAVGLTIILLIHYYNN